MKGKEGRQAPRRPLNGFVQLLWVDALSGQHSAKARCFDISESGIQVEMERALPARTLVKIQAPKLGLVGMASVRHCTRQGLSKHRIGLEFTAGLKWKPPDAATSAG